MIVYKQNVNDVLRELNRAADDMETLAKMYLDEPLPLQDAIGYVHSAQDLLTGLQGSTPAVAATE